MTILSSSNNTTRIMIYAMVCTLVVSFGAMGAVISFKVSPNYALMGLFLGSAIGAFISVYESTIIGCMTGMIVGLCTAPIVYYFIDFVTAYMVIFVMSLLGAFLGEPIAYFWREANTYEDEDKNGNLGKLDFSKELVASENKNERD